MAKQTTESSGPQQRSVTLHTLAIVQSIEFSNIKRTQCFSWRSKVLAWVVNPHNGVHSILCKSFPVVVHNGLEIVIFSYHVNCLVCVLVKLIRKLCQASESVQIETKNQCNKKTM